MTVIHNTFFWILVTCGNGNTQASCGECPKPTSETDGNCVSGDCAVAEFTTAFNPLTYDSDYEFFCTSKYLSRVGKMVPFSVQLKGIFYCKQLNISTESFSIQSQRSS